jgi:hypothetical protein
MSGKDANRRLGDDVDQEEEAYVRLPDQRVLPLQGEAGCCGGGSQGVALGSGVWAPLARGQEGTSNWIELVGA